jgi:hypothetical protein
MVMDHGVGMPIAHGGNRVRGPRYQRNPSDTSATRAELDSRQAESEALTLLATSLAT